MIRNIFTIFKRETASYFNSNIAWIVLAALIGAHGWLFVVFNINTGLTDLSQSFLILAQFIFVIICPLISVFLLSEEKSRGTVELLLTSPVNTFEIVCGKYLSALALFTAYIMVALLFPLIMSFYGDVNWPLTLLQYLGLYFLGATFIGIGMVASSLTENVIIAGIIGIAVPVLLIVLWITSFSTYGIVSVILEELTVYTHFKAFINGIFDLKHVLYFLLWIIFSIFLSARMLENYSWGR